ncbi:MAG TPA: serine hydrolase [Flavisolibacter sp.]|nr:serine hydrolase [Flavisolibacter sp.]
MSYKISFNCLKFSPALLFLLFFQPLMGQGNKKIVKELGTANYGELDETVQRNQKALGGNFVTLLWTDTIVYKRESGEFDSRTLAPLESASQWLTAALVMKMVEEGKLSLDDKVAKYLPIFESYGKSYITIRHCLSHFTGIQTDGGFLSKKKFGSLEEEVEAFAKKEIQANPGTEFRYSNAGPNIAGRILEVITKKKFDMLAKQKLFNPLGMRKSTFGNLDGSALSPASGAQSSADEFMNFLQMLLNKGQFKGQPFLTEASVQELRKLQTTPALIKYAPKGAEGYGYALGSWVVEEGKDAANALSGPALPGCFPLIDWCRGYALLLFTKNSSTDQKKETLLALKNAADEKLPSKCR